MYCSKLLMDDTKRALFRLLGVSVGISVVVFRSNVSRFERFRSVVPFSGAQNLECLIRGFHSELLQEARKVISTMPENDIMTSRINPFALAVAKSVQNAP